MLQYEFVYNLPKSNSTFGCIDTMIRVRAFQCCSDIHLEFVNLGSGTLMEVINWREAIAEMQSLAKTEFEMMQAVDSTLKIVA
jgi:hypothetical protein